MTRGKVFLILFICILVSILLIRQIWDSGSYSDENIKKPKELPTGVEGTIEQYYVCYELNTTGTLSQSELNKINVTILIPIWQRHIYTGVRYLVWDPICENKYYYVLINPANKSFGNPLILAFADKINSTLLGKQVEVCGYLKLRRVKIASETSDVYILYAKKIKSMD